MYALRGQLCRHARVRAMQPMFGGQARRCLLQQQLGVLGNAGQVPLRVAN